MKKLIVLSLIMAGIVLIAGFFTPSHAQDTAKDDTPTFYHLVPGTYVNGWPRFTIHYPKDWVEKRFRSENVFVVGPPGSAKRLHFDVTDPPNMPLDTMGDYLLRFFRVIATDVTLVTDKPTQLHDGTAAWEDEFTYVMNGVPAHFFGLAITKGDQVICVNEVMYDGKIEDDLKAYLYSLEFQPGHDEQVKVPPDVQEFLDEVRNDTVAHDLAKVMSHYSDRYLNSGTKKGEIERSWKLMVDRITSFEIVITDFVPAGDKA